MEYQTWTRKINARAAVTEILQNVSMDFAIVDIIASDVSGNGKRWAVVVELDNPPSDADALQDILGNKARVKALRPEPVPVEAGGKKLPTIDNSAEVRAMIDAHDAEQEAEEEADKEAERQTKKGRQSNGRNSPSKGCRISIVGGKDAANPYRPGSKSHAAFEFLQKHPGTLFEDLQGFGIRIRTVTEMLRHGQARRT